MTIKHKISKASRRGVKKSNSSITCKHEINIGFVENSLPKIKTIRVQSIYIVFSHFVEEIKIRIYIHVNRFSILPESN